MSGILSNFHSTKEAPGMQHGLLPGKEAAGGMRSAAKVEKRRTGHGPDLGALSAGVTFLQVNQPQPVRQKLRMCRRQVPRQFCEGRPHACRLGTAALNRLQHSATGIDITAVISCSGIWDFVVTATN